MFVPPYVCRQTDRGTRERWIPQRESIYPLALARTNEPSSVYDEQHFSPGSPSIVTIALSISMHQHYYLSWHYPELPLVRVRVTRPRLDRNTDAKQQTKERFGSYRLKQRDARSFWRLTLHRWFATPGPAAWYFVMDRHRPLSIAIKRVAERIDPSLADLSLRAPNIDVFWSKIHLRHT